MLRTALAAAMFAGGVPAALAQASTSPDYQAGYAAGYQAALAAMRAAAPAVSAPAPAAAPAPAPVPAAAPAPAAAVPPDWWNHSALLYPALAPAWRHHVQLRVSAASMNGNDTGHAVNGAGNLFSRYGRWTNELAASVDKRNIVQPGPSLNERDTWMLQDSVRYDLGQRAYASAGVILERDDVNSVERRDTVLAGAGYYLVDNAALRVNAFAGLGRLHETYLAPVPALIGLDGRNSGLLYLYQTVDWQINPDWALQQGFRQIRDLDASGRYVAAAGGPTPYVAAAMVKRYRNLASVGLNYRLSPRSALSFSVESRYDSNPWPDVKPRDTVRRLSVNLMY